MGRPVWVIDHEGADYDFVAVWKNNRDNYYAPTQLGLQAIEWVISDQF